MRTTRYSDQSGIVGRFIVGWLLIVAVLGIGAVDGASIAFTTLRLSDVAVAAASEAASRYRSPEDAGPACEAAARAVQIQDPEMTLLRCRVDDLGVATVTLRKKASTLVVGRIDMLKKYGRVTRTEAVGGSSV